jgi:hypothetical protein
MTIPVERRRRSAVQEQRDPLGAAVDHLAVHEVRRQRGRCEPRRTSIRCRRKSSPPAFFRPWHEKCSRRRSCGPRSAKKSSGRSGDPARGHYAGLVPRTRRSRNREALVRAHQHRWTAPLTCAVSVKVLIVRNDQRDAEAGIGGALPSGVTLYPGGRQAAPGLGGGSTEF